VNVTWQEPESPGDAPIDAFRIYREDDIMLGVAPAEARSFNINDAPTGQDLIFHVEAVNEFGASPRAAAVPIRLSGPPSEVCDDSADNDGDGKVDADDPDCQEPTTPRTTMRNDRGRQYLDRHATYIFAIFFAIFVVQH
jgi:hypothetical protein